MLIVPWFSGTSGGVARRRETDTNFTNLSMPPDVAFAKLRASGQLLNGRLYVVGLFNPGLVVGEDFDSPTWRLGINAPSLAPVLSAVTPLAGQTGVTGPAIGAYRFLHRRNEKLVAASPVGPQSAAVQMTNQARSWASIPSAAPSRVTHIQGVVSMNGGLFRTAWERAIGSVTTLVEAVPTGSLGSAPDTSLFNVEAAEFSAVFAKRMWYAGISCKRNRALFSEINDPEILAGFVETLDGSAIRGLGPRSDELILFGEDRMHTVRGYTARDFVVRKIHGSIGSISHHAIRNIHDQLWFPYLDGVYVYGGGIPIKVSEDISPVWEAHIKAAKEGFYDSTAVVDFHKYTYAVLIPGAGAGLPASVWYVGQFQDYYQGTGPVMFEVDARGRQDVAGLQSNVVGDRLTVSEDGIVRREDQDANADDDGDSFVKRFVARHGINYFGSPGGTREDGKQFTQLYSFVESDFTAWRLNVMGVEGASGIYAIRPDNSLIWWKDDVAASALSQALGGNTYVYTAEESHVHYPERVSGQGLLVEVTANSPKKLRYFGYGGFYAHGPSPRKARTKNGLGADPEIMDVLTDPGVGP